MNKKPRCQDVILTSTGVFSVCHGIVSRFYICGILTVAWISSISLWEKQKFTLKNLHFWAIKSFISLKYMPILHFLPSRISKFSGGGPPNQNGGYPLLDSPVPVACSVSAYFQKFSIYLKTFWEPCIVYIKKHVYASLCSAFQRIEWPTFAYKWNIKYEN